MSSSQPAWIVLQGHDRPSASVHDKTSVHLLFRKEAIECDSSYSLHLLLQLLFVLMVVLQIMINPVTVTVGMTLSQYCLMSVSILLCLFSEFTCFFFLVFLN